MARPPLVLSAHSSAWSADAGQGGRGTRADGTGLCQYCGQSTGGWQGPSPVSASPAALRCALCELPQNLNRAEIDREAILVWLPEMAQPALNILVRQIHLACFQAGTAPAFGDGSHAKAPPSATPAIMTYRTLHDRAATAEVRLGTASPRQLGVALLALKAADYERRAALMGGLRLLSLGRFFHEGRDIYPDMLRAWAAMRGQPA
jgi:intracellular multiplication protein IcmJ